METNYQGPVLISQTRYQCFSKYIRSANNLLPITMNAHNNDAHNNAADECSYIVQKQWNNI